MRTKKEIIADFEELGFTIKEDEKYFILCGWSTQVMAFVKKEKWVDILDDCVINIKGLKLIYELCKFWGWL